jgi:hypothetical protein
MKLQGVSMATGQAYNPLVPLAETEGKSMSDRYSWSRLNGLQVGRYAEYYVKMEFTVYGFDENWSEVDDQGIDMVVRRAENRYCDVQVKSSRALNYIFFPKDNFALRDNLLAAIEIH